MADRTQNININYNLRTVGAEQARATVAAVDTATKNLNQTAQTTGQRLSSAFQQGTGSLLSMQLQLARLKTQIEVATDPAKVARLSAQYKALDAQIKQTNQSLFQQEKAMKQVSTETKGLTTNIGGLYAAFKTVIAGGIIKELVGLSLEMATLSGNVEGVERAFNRAFPDAENLLNDLRLSTRGTVTDFELMQKTLQATNLGVSAERLGVLFEFAAARAQQTGESIDYLTNSIVTGIGRKSIRVIDNLGISAIALKEELGGVAAASASVAEITEAVARIAQRELNKMGGYAETAATQVSQLKVAWEDLRLEAARVTEGMNVSIVEFLKNAAEGAKALFQVRGDLSKLDDLAIANEQKLLALQDVRRIKQREASDESLKDTQKRFDFIQQEINTRVQLIGTYNDEIGRLRERKEALRSDELVPSLTKLVQLFGEENRAGEINNFLTRDQIKLRVELNERRERELESISKEIKAWQVNRGTISATIELLKQYLSTIDTLNKDQTDELGIIEAKREQIKAIQEQIETTRNSSNLSSRLGIGKLITDLEVAQAELKELLEGPINTEFKVKFNLDGLRDEVKAVKEAFMNLETGETFEIPISPPKPKSKALQDFEKQAEELLKNIAPIPVPLKPVVITPTSLLDQIGGEIERNRDEIINSGFDIFSDQLKATEEIELASLQNRLNNLRNYYDEQQILAGDNERAKKEIRLREERETAALQKKIAEKDRQVRRFSIILDTATGIMRAFATLPTPAAIVQSAIIAALGASQLSIVNRTPARFAKGVLQLNGPGTETSDSIPAMLSKGESVMTAKETRRSLGLLEAIRENKIDDRILRNLQLGTNGVTMVPWDNKPVVDAINSNRGPDFVKVGRQMYEVFKDREGNKKYIKSKSF